MGHCGPPGLGQYFVFAMALRTALTGINMAWTKNKWDNNDYILFCLFSYQCFNEKIRKTLSVSGTVTFLFFQLRHFFLVCFRGIVLLFCSFKVKAHSFNSKGKKKQQ